MSVDEPDYHDADLVLRVYEMRREAKTRENRDAISFQFWPKSYDEVKEIGKFDHPLNGAWRQLSSYWEMVYRMARNGIVNADYLTQNNGEGIFFLGEDRSFLGPNPGGRIADDVPKRRMGLQGNGEWTDSVRVHSGHHQEAVRIRLAARDVRQQSMLFAGTLLLFFFIPCYAGPGRRPVRQASLCNTV